jgi:hypothetical protein
VPALPARSKKDKRPRPGPELTEAERLAAQLSDVIAKLELGDDATEAGHAGIVDTLCWVRKRLELCAFPATEVEHRLKFPAPPYLGPLDRETWLHELQLLLELHVDKRLARELGKLLDDADRHERYAEREIRDLRRANEELEAALEEKTFRNIE